MTNLILQPSGGAGKKNFDNTIKNRVSLSNLKPFLSKMDYDNISNYYDDGLVPIWGVTQGKKNVNTNKWNKIKVGDVALFTSEMKIFASGIVTYKLQSRDLALKLWGEKEEGFTWENIYLLDEIKVHSIPVKELNVAVGYSPNKAVMGFSVLSDEKSESFLNLFNLESYIYYPSVTEDEYKKVLKELDSTKPLDKKVETIRRTEQAFLRKYLFGNKKQGQCGICSNVMPVEFLVAAHIKKRSYCSDEEKLDYKHVVMPMCKFGCDELFEKGCISVQRGEIFAEIRDKYTPFVKDYINQLVGRPCKYWMEETKKYFEWHCRFHLKK